jgi:SAM-dependent methyltransferase
MMPNIFVKWRFYRAKYGALHAILVFLGHRWGGIWRICAPVVTMGYLHRWLERHPENRILNLGGGGNLRDEWLTADIESRADVYMDIQHPLPLKDHCLDAVYLEEVIEHISYEQARSLLLECHRVLRPGSGRIRITTPSLNWFIKQRDKPVSEGALAIAARVQLGAYAQEDAAMLPTAAFNAIFYSYGHCFIYDEVSLAHQLARSGFEEIGFGQYRQGTALAQFDSHAERFNHPPEMSLYVEASNGVGPG